jgi:hypothetical protein
MGKEANRNEMKNALLSDVQSILSERLNSDVLRVGSSEIAIPAVDKDGNEFFYLVKISIPRGTRNGEGGYTEYDAYAAADDYKFDLEEKAAKKAASEAKKAAAEKERERKREAKKVVKELNQKGLKGMIEGAE